MMIGEVAAASGFDNCCSFARAFRARFGVSATALPRRRARSAAAVPSRTRLGKAKRRSPAKQRSAAIRKLAGRLTRL